MKILFSNSLSYRFANQAILVSLAISLLVTVLLIYVDFRLSKDRIFEDTRALLQSGKQTGQLAVYNLDTDLTQTIANGLTEYPGVVYAVIYDHNGNTLGRSRRSPQLSRYRWISDALIGNNQPLLADLKAPKSQASLGQILIEIDTFILGKRFLQRASLLFVGGMMLAAFITLLLILLHRRHLTKPLQIMITQLSEIDPKSPENQRLDYPLEHDADEIGTLVEQINKLLLSISSNAARRERAESDLRKNLSSVEYIVTERTEALRSTSLRLQTQLHTYQKQIEQYQQEHNLIVQGQQQLQMQQQHVNDQLLYRLQLMQTPLKRLTYQHDRLLQQSLNEQLQQNCHLLQHLLLPSTSASNAWVSHALELMARNLAPNLREQQLELHCSFESPLAAVWRVPITLLLLVCEQITLRIAEHVSTTFDLESPGLLELHLRGRLNVKHQPGVPHLQLTWSLSHSNASLLPLLDTMLTSSDIDSQYLREILDRCGAILRLSARKFDHLRLLIPIQSLPGTRLQDWSANFSLKKLLLMWCDQQDALRHLQNTLRGLGIAFDTFLIETNSALDDHVVPVSLEGYLGCITNHTPQAQRFRQQALLHLAEFKSFEQVLNNTDISYPLRQQDCLQLLLGWSTKPTSPKHSFSWLVIENHPIHQAMIRMQLTLCSQTCLFAEDEIDASNLLSTNTCTHLLINPNCLTQPNEFIASLHHALNTAAIAIHWLGIVPKNTSGKYLPLPFTIDELSHFLSDLELANV